MSDVNNGVDDYQSKDESNSAYNNADYSQNNQSYGQAYDQSYDQSYGQAYSQPDQQYSQPSQQYAQPMQQPQFAQLYQQYEQSSISQQYAKQPDQQSSQQPNQQYAQQSNQQYAQQYNQFPVGQQSQYFQPQYSQSQYGGQYGGQYGNQYVGGSFTNQYGAYQAGAAQAFGYQTGYANGGFNPAYIEEQARKFSSKWNSKEIISSILVCILAGILAFVLFRYEFSVLYKTMWFIAKKLFRYHDKHYNLLGIAFNASYLLPLTLILGFAQVIRKRFFTVASGAFIFAIIFLIRIFFAGEAINFSLIQDCLLVSLPILIFVVFVEALQQAITRYRPKNGLNYMLINFASAIIFCIAEIIVEIIYNSISNSGSMNILTTAVEFLIPAVLLLVILPYLIALLLNAVKFTKFLNPEREMMNL